MRRPPSRETARGWSRDLPISFTAMFYARSRPDPPLDDFVDRFWICHDAPAHSREQILPTGTLELVINLHADEFRVYDPVHPDRYRMFRGAMASGAYGREFSGLRPTDYSKRRGARVLPNHVPADRVNFFQDPRRRQR